MSTEQPARRQGTRAEAARRRRKRAFAGAFAVVIGALAVIGLAGAAASTVQGPRVTQVDIDPAAAAEASGARLIVTTNQSLATVDAAQVTVTPAVPFTVDTSGRSVGVRFTLPLRDATEYAVRIDDVKGLGGGPAATVTHEFRTPELTAFLLQRTGDGDTIYRTDLAGERIEAVFEHPHIEDFRATTGHLVISTLDDDGRSQILVTDLDGDGERALRLPGEGTVRTLQAADRGELIGYTFTDADIGAGGTRESELYTASVKDSRKDAEPSRVAVGGTDPRVLDWRFVPDTDSLLVLTFDGRLLLSGADGAGSTDLGAGVEIDGIARGSAVAVVERVDGMVLIDLTDGSETSLAPAEGIAGLQGVVTPIPGAGAGTIRQFFVADAPPDEQVTNVYRVADDGAPTLLFTAPATDAVLQTCVSPSGRYAAVLVAPDTLDNAYDTYQHPLPSTLHTHVIDIASGDAVQTFAGFDLSWCQTAPPVGQ